MAKKWTTQSKSQARCVGDDEAFDEVDFLADQEPTEMNSTHITEKEKVEPPIVDFDFDPDMDVDLMMTEEHHGERPSQLWMIHDIVFCFFFNLVLACRYVIS